MCPVAQSDGHDGPRLVDALVPGSAAVVNQVVVGGEDAVRQPVLAHELPDVFLGVQFRTFRRQRNDGDVLRHDEMSRHVPARSSSSAAWRPGSTSLEMAARCWAMASVLHQGITRAAPLPCLGQMAPKMSVDAVRWSCGAEGRVPRLAQRRVSLFFWPTRASSPNQISSPAGSIAFSRASAARRTRKLF